ncbi:MAG TPA: cyclopropane-fatty-acyl-phospholipid synthase family protein [Pseudobdellovibrionaceae bacterium]|jgi:cyclopropane-fatty-acyl-phospholipid synthase
MQTSFNNENNQWARSSSNHNRWAMSSAPLRSVFSRIICSGSLRLIDANGNQYDFGDGKPPFVSMHIHNPRLHYKLVLNPELYFGEAYMDGEIAIEKGSLKDFFTIFFQNMAVAPAHSWLKILASLSYLRRPLQQLNTAQRSHKNVAHHYDLSVGFYDLFLDSERQYSCAYFETGTESLEEAQKKKMAHILAKLLVEKKHHVLDIGCGWGGLSLYIARETGARVTGITLSQEQLLTARHAAHAQGLNGQVKFELLDYRHIEGPFDRIVSVGMFEHVGINNYRAFFGQMKSLLASDGVALLHSIGRAHGPSSTSPWIRKYIFPGGYTPALSEVLPHVERSGLYLTDMEILRLHYASTLKMWRERFEKNRDQAPVPLTEKFCRMWEFYLTCSETAFEKLGLNVFQMQLATRQELVPLTRDYLLNR